MRSSSMRSRMSASAVAHAGHGGLEAGRPVLVVGGQGGDPAQLPVEGVEVAGERLQAGQPPAQVELGVLALVGHPLQLGPQLLEGGVDRHLALEGVALAVVAGGGGLGHPLEVAVHALDVGRQALEHAQAPGQAQLLGGGGQGRLLGAARLLRHPAQLVAQLGDLVDQQLERPHPLGDGVDPVGDAGRAPPAGPPATSPASRSSSWRRLATEISRGVVRSAIWARAPSRDRVSSATRSSSRYMPSMSEVSTARVAMRSSMALTRSPTMSRRSSARSMRSPTTSMRRPTLSISAATPSMRRLTSLVGGLETADDLVLVVLDPGRGRTGSVPRASSSSWRAATTASSSGRSRSTISVEQPLAPADVARQAVDLAVDAVEVALQRLHALEPLVEGGDVVVELGPDGVVGGGGLLGDAVELPAQLVEGAFEGGGAPGHVGRRRLLVGEQVVGDLLHLRPQLPHRALQQPAAQRGPGQLGEVGRARRPRPRTGRARPGRRPDAASRRDALPPGAEVAARRSPRSGRGPVRASPRAWTSPDSHSELPAEALDAGGGPGQGLLPGLQRRQPVGDGRHLLGGQAQGLLARLHLARHPQQPAAHALGVGGAGGQRPQPTGDLSFTVGHGRVGREAWAVGHEHLRLTGTPPRRKQRGRGRLEQGNATRG